MKIIISKNCKKSIFTNKKYYVPITSSMAKADFDPAFYGEIGKYLYVVKNKLITDQTIGFVKNNHYFSFLKNDLNDEIYENLIIPDKIIAIVEKYSTFVAQTGILNIIDEMKIYLKNKILNNITDENIINDANQFITDFFDLLKNFIGEESYNILLNDQKIIPSNICILSNDVFYTYGQFLIELLDEVKKLPSYKKLIKHKDLPAKNKKIGEFISDRTLNILNINKISVFCEHTKI